MASGRTPAHDQAIDKEEDDGADDSAEEACGLVGTVPSDGLPEVSRNEGAHDPQNGRQDEAPRLCLVAGHDELGNHSNNEANDNRPKDVHLSAPREPAFDTMNILREIAFDRS